MLGHDPTSSDPGKRHRAGRGRHAAPQPKARRWQRTLTALAAAPVLLLGGTAIASTLGNAVNYQVAAPVTVQALGTSTSTPTVGQSVTAGVKVVAERDRTFDYVVLAVRDPAGRNVDFPGTRNWQLGTTQKVYTATRTFATPGTYTYWFAYLQNGRWTELNPRQTFSVVASGGTADPSPTATAPSPQPSPTSSSPAPSPTSSSPSAPPTTEWPGPNNTGVPSGVALTNYTGPCTITVPNTVIDAKTVNCDLSVKTTGVKITRSKVNGNISSPGGVTSSYTVADSEVDASPGSPRQVSAIGDGDAVITVLRTEARGGHRGVYCAHNCTVRDSWIHGQEVTSDWHAGGIRMSQHNTIVHNTIVCDAPDTPQGGGCSADLTGYPDFEPIATNRIENNLFKASTGGFCAYGGATKSKPYSGQDHDIVFIDNVFERGSGGKCGYWGPITDFNASRPGNQWINNKFNDGTPITP